MTIQDRVSLRRCAYPSRDESAGERDRLLVEAHLRHDADAFAIIVDDHRAALLGQARRMLGPDEAAEDLVQETFVRALRGLHRFGRTGDYRLGAWLSQILKNVVHDHRARAAREFAVAQASAAEPRQEADVAEQVGDPVVAAALNAAVLNLPSTQRDAFVMREMVGLSYPDVAEVLNISEENARARVSRGKGLLRLATADLRTAAGGLVGIPAGLRWLQGSLSARLHRPKSHVLGASDRVAVQLSASPVSQTALNLVATTPRGSIIFGLAATVATLSASTAVLVGSGPAVHPSLAAAPVMLTADQSGGSPHAAATTPLTAPVVTTTPAPSTGGGSYAWVNPATAGGGGSASGTGTAAAAPATCVPSDGVTPPGTGFSAGTPLGLANAVSVATTPAVELDTTGSSLAFSTSASITEYGSIGAPSVATVVSNVCLSSSGAWYTASISGIGSSPVELVGALQETIGSGNDPGYVFRGTLSPSDSVTGPLAGAVQFVVEVALTEPDNTAQLTIVFLGTTPNPAGVGGASQPTSGAATTGPSSDPTTGASTGTGGASSTPTSGVPIVSPTGGLVGAGASGTPSIFGGALVGSLSPLSSALGGHGLRAGMHSAP